MIEVEMDMKIVSVANMRLHWAAKARLTKSQRQKTRNALAAVAQSFGVEVLPVTIVLTRVAPRRLDGDNLQSGFKAVRVFFNSAFLHPDNAANDYIFIANRTCSFCS